VCGFRFSFFLSSGGTGTLLGIDFLDIFTFGKSPLVRSKTSLGELVNTLIRSRSTCLDHIQNTLLVRGQTNDLTSNRTAQFGFGRCNLFCTVVRIVIEEGSVVRTRV
jgi:hypothetical protein